MGRIIIRLILLIYFGIIYNQTGDSTGKAADKALDAYLFRASAHEGITAMEALDGIKTAYAANFSKIKSGSPGTYYYKLDGADYYLIYEGLDADGLNYLIHLYEFVIDDPESGTGHTVTYGWFRVSCCQSCLVHN